MHEGMCRFYSGGEECVTRRRYQARSRSDALPNFTFVSSPSAGHQQAPSPLATDGDVGTRDMEVCVQECVDFTAGKRSVTRQSNFLFFRNVKRTQDLSTRFGMLNPLSEKKLQKQSREKQGDAGHPLIGQSPGSRRTGSQSSPQRVASQQSGPQTRRLLSLGPHGGRG